MSDSPEARQLESTASKAHNPAQQSPSEDLSTSVAAAPSGPTPQSGSHALRIASNPNLPGPPPMFVKQPMQQLADRDDSGNSVSEQSSKAGRARTEDQQSPPDEQPQGKRKAAGKGDIKQARRTNTLRSNRPPRLQHDDPFLAYDVVVA